MRRKRVVALLLSSAMLVASVLPVLAAGEGKSSQALENQVLSLGFEGNLDDSSGKGNNGTLSAGQAQYVEGILGNAVKLNGSSYINLGTSTELQPQNMTLSFWMKPDGTMGNGEQVITWNKNTYDTDGWYLSTQKDLPLILSIGPSKKNGQPYNVAVSGSRDEFFTAGEWTHVAITYDSESKEVKFYRNGKQCESVIKYGISGESTGVLGADESMEKSIGYNGPVYKGAYLNAALDEYQLYNDVASAGQVVALYEESGQIFDKKAVAEADLNAISIPSEVQGNISLPTTGASGSVITWTSDNEQVITEDGTVTRPEIGEENVEVTLNASAIYEDGEAAEKAFPVTVLAKQEINISTDSIMGDVALSDDFLVNASSKEVDYLLSLDSEKFLYEFYKLAGLKPKTDSGYEGWERSHGNNFRGHAFGHYMSALSQAYLTTVDSGTKDKLLAEIKEAVNGLKECQDAYASKYPASAGYISPFPEEWLKDKDGVNLAGTKKINGDTVYVPYYNLHKVLAGLIDVTKNVDDSQIKETALSVAEGFGEYLNSRLGRLTDKNKMLRTEYGGMNEALYELYNITGNDHYKTAAQYFDETELFGKLANNQDVLNGLHANTTIPKLIGALKRYTVMQNNEEYYNALSQGEKDGLGMYLTAAENFWQITIDHHTYITGGNSQSEHFHEADKIGYDATKSTYDASTTCETCNTYNMLKLSKELYKVTGDKKYMDYFENTYINAILSSQNPETGTTMYFQPMAPGYNKVFNRPFDEFWCCTGTGMENFSKLGDNIYSINGDGVSVHMFFSSEVTDASHNLRLTQDANMPNSDTATFTVAAADGGTVAAGTTLRLRKPDWLAGDAVIMRNGEMAGLEEENGYYLVKNVKEGDEISYQMPMKVVVYRMPDKPDMVAFKYGPVALSAGLSTNSIEASNPNGILVRVGTFDASSQTVITVEGSSVEEWLGNLADNLVRIEDSADGRVQFKLQNVDSQSEQLVYTPHYMRYQERYGLYMYMEEPDSQASQDRILENKEKAREEEMSTDYLNSFDDNNSEAAKGQKGERTAVGVFNGRGYRDAQKDGWFSYDMKIDPDAEHIYLNCTYYSGDAGRSFDIYINDQKFKTVVINKNAGENVFYTDTYEVDKKFLTDQEEVNKKFLKSGSDTMTVRFQSLEGNKSYVGGLFGISTSTTNAYDTDASLSGLSFDKGTLSPEFTPDQTEYTLEVPMSADSVNMLATPKMGSGLVYADGILIDDKHKRAISLGAEETILNLTAKAQDHKTTKEYKITIKKMDIPELNKSPLMDKIDLAKNIEKGNYTDESYAALQKAIKAAEEALNTVATEEEVNTETAKLQKAIDSLKEKEEQGENPGEGQQNPNGSQGQNPDNQNGSSTGSSNGQNHKSDRVKTGDVAPIVLLVIASLTALGAMAVIIRRKRKYQK